jgi:hypothetical protein
VVRGVSTGITSRFDSDRRLPEHLRLVDFLSPDNLD